MKTLSVLCLLLTMGCIIAFSPRLVYDPAFTGRLTAQMQQYAATLPQEKVYLHLDKPFYQPGDDIWFKVYLQDSRTHASSATSEIVYVELINPKGSVEKTLTLVAQGGKAAGDFSLDAQTPGGIYKVKAYTQWMKNFGPETFFEKEIPVQTVLLPRLRMNLEFERKAYGAADPVTAAFNLADLANRPLKDFPFSFTVQLGGREYFRGKGRTDKEGLAQVSFKLPKQLETNDGLLNVLMEYEGSTESISRSVPIVLNRIDLQFFPEGGDLVEDVESRVAFKALNEFGKPADVEGLVLDEDGKTVTQLRSYHLGMGAFSLRPTSTRAYKVRLTQPAGIQQEFTLPRALARGYTLSVLQASASTLRVRITSPIAQPTVLVAQVRGTLCFSKELSAVQGETFVDIPVSAFPMGVARLTLFDYKETPRCERLVFVNKQKQLRITIQPDKEQYQPREKVTLKVRVQDEDGLPAAANLSLAVVDDKLVSFADDKQDNLLSYLLLSSDVRGKVEEPHFYFKPDEPKADQALDYLLMTQGWRRFEWREVLKGSPEQWRKQLTQTAEKAVVRGRVMQLNRTGPLAGAKVTVLETEEVTYTDQQGQFEFRNLNLSTPRTLQATTEDGFSRIITVNDYASEYTIGKAVSGRVLSQEDKSPLPGVNVVVKGTAVGTTTDFNGFYHLELPAQAGSLVFSFIGYVSEEIPIGAQNTVNATLGADIKALQEVVVMGYAAEDNVAFEAPPAPAAPRARQDQPNRVKDRPLQATPQKVPAQAAMPLMNALPENAPPAAKRKAKDRPIAEEAAEEEILGDIDQQVYTVVEQMPEFPGGQARLQEYLNAALEYPISDLQAGREGTVFVQFLVGADGTLSEANVIKGISSECDAEVLRAVSAMPPWIPGRQNDQATAVRYVLPIRFKKDEYLRHNPGGLLLEVSRRTPGLLATGSRYYRARTFYVPRYKADEKVDIRTDFRQTIYWNPNLEVDHTGEATVTFCNSDEITTFRATVEGIAPDGTPGRTSATYYTQLPFSMEAKVPAVLAFEDQLSVPLILKNNTNRALQGTLHVQAPAALEAVDEIPRTIRIAANSTATTFLHYRVTSRAGSDAFTIRFESEGMSDAFEQPVEIKAKGFPVTASFSGHELEKTYPLEMTQVVKHSVKARLVAYPNILTDLMAGVESILQEPYGCFEQTSSSTYPNILALQYMHESGTGNAKIREKAQQLIDKGYKRLVAFETPQQGYEWFGSAPAHEGLTAYGLMEFTDMQEVYASVDPNMMERTRNWMLSRRDGKGYFRLNDRSLDQFGSASAAVSHAYIVYALSETGYRDLAQELENARAEAQKTGDAYQLALVANSFLNLQQPQRAQPLLARLTQQMDAAGVEHLKADHSVTRSYGKSLRVETASLLALALLKTQPVDLAHVQSVIRFLTASRENYGGFGSTQATILALKALTQYAKFAKRTEESGTLEVYLNEKRIASKAYEKNAQGEIVLDGLEKYLPEGNHTLTVKFAGTRTALPYTLDVRWSTYTPRSQPECKVDLNTQLTSQAVKVGETVRLTTTLKNKSRDGLPMVVALVGIPSGLSAQPWQLKELQEKGKVDFYEVKKNYVVFYYRSLAPAAQHEISLDLKAEIPGTYESPASSAYLYYTSEYKDWSGGETIRISPR